MRDHQMVSIERNLKEFERLNLNIWNRSVKPPSAVQAFDPLCEVQSDKASVGKRACLGLGGRLKHEADARGRK